MRSRLLNRARADKVDFNLMLTRYVLERLSALDLAEVVDVLRKLVRV